ncbi:MAG: choice-of-anchor D domain-containing protein [Actinomycetia bacterium]|nr:choice-of-anchor D domain-containing protein [Actinomycetes bacterium]MCH9801748.1 choice-of-anchor D domain-containing protein [Actinomycetes bacterium]
MSIGENNRRRPLLTSMMLAVAGAGLLLTGLSAPAEQPARAAASGGLANSDCDALVPPGSIAFWLKSEAPTGWKKLNGSSFSTSTYPKLHASLQGSSGYSSGKLPNFSGRWLVGKGSTSSARAAMKDNNSTQAGLGEKLGYLTGAPQSNSTSTGNGHSFKYGVDGSGSGTSNGRGWISGKTNQSIPTTTDGDHTHPITGGDSSTRPPSVVGHWLIKADHQGACTSQSLVPVGLVVATTSSSTPSGWLSMTGVSTSGNSGLESYFNAVSTLDRNGGKTPNWNGRYLTEWKSGWQLGQKLSSQTKLPRKASLTTSSGGAHSHSIGSFGQTGGGGGTEKRRANANTCSSSSKATCNNPPASNPNVTGSQSNGSHTISGDSVTRPDSLTVRWIVRGDYPAECRADFLLPPNSVVAGLSSSTPAGWTGLNNTAGGFLVQTGDHAGSSVNSQISRRTKTSALNLGSPSPATHTHRFGSKNYDDGISGAMSKVWGAAGKNSLGSKRTSTTDGSHSHSVSGWDFTTRPDSVVVNWVNGTSDMPQAECPYLKVSPRQVEFGDVRVNETGSEDVALAAIPGGSVTASSAVEPEGQRDDQSLKPADGCVISAGQIAFTDECAGKWSFSPTRTGPLAAAWRFAAPGYQDAELSVQANGVQGVLSADAIDFGLVDLARPQTRTMTVTNSAGETSDTATITGVVVDQEQEFGFSIEKDSCTGTTLAKGGSCDIVVEFAPESIGEKTAAVLVSSNAVNPVMAVGLAGNGAVGELTAVDVDFGGVEIGTDGSIKTIEVRNSATGESAGSARVTSAQVSELDQSSGFTLVADRCRDKLLAPGDACEIDVRFEPSPTPSSVGPASGVVLVTSDAANPSLQIGMSARGTFAMIDSEPVSAVNEYQGDLKLELRNIGTANLLMTDLQVVRATGEPADLFSIPDTSDCTDAPVTPRSKCSVEVKFDSQQVDGSYAAIVRVTSNAGLGQRSGPTDIAVGAVTPLAELKTKPGAFDKPTEIGASRRSNVKIRNVGEGAVGIERVTLASGSDEFEILNYSDCKGRLAADESCVVKVEFTPTELGARGAELRVKRSAGRDSFLPLAGRGATALLAAPIADFPDTAVGGNSEQKVRVRNVGAVPLRIKNLVVPGKEFSVKDGNCRDGKIPAGKGCRAVVKFAPREGGLRSAAITVTSNNLTSPDQFLVQGVGLIGQLSADITDFGSVAVGDSASKKLRVTNSGDAPISIGRIKVFGDVSEFIAEGPGCKVKTLLPGKSCTVPVRFSPSETGPRHADVRVLSDSASSPDWLAVVGEGVQATISADPVDFGTVDVGSVATRNLRLDNIGDGSLAVKKAEVVDDADEFDVANDGDCTDRRVKPGSSCVIKVRYFPRGDGSSAAVVKLTSNTGGSPNLVALAGTGQTLTINDDSNGAAGVPDKVRKLQVPAKQRSARTAVATWKKPKNIGGGPITAYESRISKPGKKRAKGYTRWKSQDWVPAPNGKISRKFTKLVANRDYVVQVRAVNVFGAGPKAKVAFTAGKRGIPTKYGTG